MGLVMLLLLAGIAAAYFILLDDERVRALAEGQLADLLGRPVRIRAARFEVFGPLRLEGVEIPDVPGSSAGKPVRVALTAEVISVHHRPWSLLAGELRPTRIVCEEPIVTVSCDLAEKFPAGRRQMPEVELPSGLSLSIRGGKVRLRYLEKGKPLATHDIALGAAMVDRSGEPGYRLMLEARAAGTVLHGEATIGAGRNRLDKLLRDVTLLAPIDLIRTLLPPAVAARVAEFQLGGMVRVVSTAVGPYDGQAADVELSGVTAVIPDRIAPVKLTNARGKIRVHPGGVEILEDVSGKLHVLAGKLKISAVKDCILKLSGRYDGFEADSPCAITAEVDGFDAPASLGAGVVGKEYAILQELFQVKGKADLLGRFTRKAGKEDFQGQVELLGASGSFAEFPYPVREVWGTILVDERSAKNFRITGVTDVPGQARPANVRIAGHASFYLGEPYDVTVEVDDAAFDQALYAALPPGVQRAWRRINPRGRGGARVRVYRPTTKKDDYHVAVTVTLRGDAAILFDRFPYPLEGIFGEMHATENSVRIDQATGSYGGMECQVIGTLDHLDRDDPEIDLDILLFDMPLDETFIKAVEARGPDSAKALRSLHVGGKAAMAHARVRQGKDRDLDFDVRATLKGANFKLDVFPYALTDMSGRLRITPERVVMEDMRGRHGEGKVSLFGDVVLGGKGVGLERLGVTAQSIALDQDLFTALPADAKKVWNLLKPSGRATVKMSLEHRDTADPRELDYHVFIQPEKASVTYQEFPYPVSGVIGRITVIPGWAWLDQMRAVHGKTDIHLEGELETGDRPGATLKLSAKNLPVEKPLIAALAKLAPKTVARLQPGGAVDVNLNRLCIGSHCPPGPTTQPADPAKRRWHTEGTLGFRDMHLDIGLSSKTLSGRLDNGVANGLGSDLAVSGDLRLDRVLVGTILVTDLRAVMAKRLDQPTMSIRRIEGKVHGGKLAGTLAVTFRDPPEYQLRVEVDGIKLESLVNAGEKDPKKRGKQSGLLAGEITAEGVAGDPNSRRGDGKLRMTEANILQLPILLEFVHLIQLRLPVPGQGAFTGADIRYELKGQQLVFRQLRLQGDLASLIGSGTLNLETDEIHLEFLSGPPKAVTDLELLPAALGQFIRRLSKELFLVRVTGTAARPKVEKIPLKAVSESIWNLIRRLVAPGQEDWPEPPVRQDPKRQPPGRQERKIQPNE